MTTPGRSAAPRTPAGRLIELRREISYLQRDLDEAKAKASRAEERLSRFTSIGGVSFGGVPIAQTWSDLLLWESILNDRKFRAVFELGTWQGGFAWWMWAQAKRRGIMFHTFDSIAPNEEPPPDTFTRRDIWDRPEELGVLLQQWEPLVLFCDNGNKPREIQTFPQYLQHPESLVIVHDWGTEVQPEDVPESLEMMYEDFCIEVGSMCRVFKAKERDA